MKKLCIGIIFILSTVFGFSQTCKDVWLEILKDSIKCPEQVYRQFCWETGWGTSYNCLKKHNLFGFNSSKGYMTFKTWQESVAYYKRWQDRHYFGGDYYFFLIRINYAADNIDYVKHLKSLKLQSFVYE